MKDRKRMAKATVAAKPERRSKPERVLVGGRRPTDPSLTTAACVRDINMPDVVDTNFLVGEILEGRLQATVIRRHGKKNIYRVAPVHLQEWKIRCLWKPIPAKTN
jgi:hypothetical protein